MSRIKFSMSLLAFALMMSFGAGSALAGTITGKVNGTDGKPAAGVTVRLIKVEADGGGDVTKPAAADADKVEKLAKPGKGEKPGKGRKNGPPVAEATTSADGTFKFENVADGNYRVQAGGKGQGGGRAMASVRGENASVNVTITLKERKPKA